MQLIYDLNGERGLHIECMTDSCQLSLWNLLSAYYINDLALVHNSSHSIYLIQVVFLSFKIIGINCSGQFKMEVLYVSTKWTKWTDEYTAPPPLYPDKCRHDLKAKINNPLKWSIHNPPTNDLRGHLFSVRIFVNSFLYISFLMFCWYWQLGSAKSHQHQSPNPQLQRLCDVLSKITMHLSFYKMCWFLLELMITGKQHKAKWKKNEKGK